MPTFGRCDLSLSGLTTVTGYDSLLRVTKEVLGEGALLSKIDVRLMVPQYPVKPGIYPFKCIIYDDDSGYPKNLQGISDIQELPDNTPKKWVTFNFSPVLNLPAGDYWIGVVRGNTKGSYADVQNVGDTGFHKALEGQDWYNNPPATFPSGAIGWENLVFICGTYEPSAKPYPTSLLKKGFISGYHCFLSAYILAKIGGYDPLKLPDGTPF